jgi:NAD(P)-dependent dehydrogenase (short-subunit alcohol dehydrogenase family)
MSTGRALRMRRIIEPKTPELRLPGHRQHRDGGSRARLGGRSDRRVAGLDPRALDVGDLDGPLPEPEHVAGVVQFLASDAASEMTGQAINITGGMVME